MLIQHKIQAGFAVALASLLLTGMTAWWSEQRNAQLFALVDHSREVIDKLDDTLVGMLNTETGNRGYAISGDEEFLQPYQAGIASAQNSFAAVKRLIQDSPAQQQRLIKLDSLIQNKITHASSVIQLRRRGDTAGALQYIGQGQGMRLMNEIRDLIATMKTEENQRLPALRAEAHALSRTTMDIVAFGCVLSLGMIGLASFIVKHDFERRQQAEAERELFLPCRWTCSASSAPTVI